MSNSPKRLSDSALFYVFNSLYVTLGFVYMCVCTCRVWCMCGGGDMHDACVCVGVHVYVCACVVCVGVCMCLLCATCALSLHTPSCSPGLPASSAPTCCFAAWFCVWVAGWAAAREEVHLSPSLAWDPGLCKPGQPLMWAQMGQRVCFPARDR